MDKLKLQRKTIKGSLTRIQNDCGDENVHIEDIKVRNVRADELFRTYELIQQQIDDGTVAADEQEREDEYRSQIENTYYSIKAICMRILDQADCKHTVAESPKSGGDVTAVMQTLIEHQSTMGSLIERISNACLENRSSPSTDTSSNARQSGNHEIRLPQIQIPEFDGKCTEWIRFRDLFETLVHNRTTIADVEKLEYLQTKVKGEALSLIKHLKPTNANYAIAWELLIKKFDNSDKVKKAYFELLFDQPQMRSSTVTEAKRIYNTTNESINALKVLNEPVEYWDSILLFKMEKKLDTETHILWYREKNVEAATFEQFMEFLEKRVFELENTQRNSSQAVNQNCNTYKRNQSRTFTALVQSCPICSKQHFLYHCNQFKEMDVDTRRNLVQRNKYCFNCLQPNHQAASCKRSSCRMCNGKHNTLLHRTVSTTEQQRDEQLQQNSNAGTTACVSVNSAQQGQRSLTLLPTAIVMVCDVFNILQPCRALLDSGSQGTLISEACVQRLQLKRSADKVMLYGVGSANGNATRGKVKIQISTKCQTTIVTDALCLTSLTQNLPSYEVSDRKMSFFANLDLADPTYLKPGNIDIILGADVFTDCVLPDKITHPSGSPTAIHTIFGWVLMGKIPIPSEQHLLTAHTYLDLSQQLQQFWEIEDFQEPIQHLTVEEKQAEEHFQKYCQRDDSGRYMVRLPLKSANVELGESQTAAYKRLLAMERRFSRDSHLQKEYTAFMEEYIKLGHMELSLNEVPDRTYYMPHHAVLKPTSTTTKLRVVFDASCKTANGQSLNDQLLVGPTIQRDLFEIIIQFRKYQIAFAADIEKMYRQVMVHPTDRSLQRILWRESNAEQPKQYNLRTVTYGTASAPFLAIRTLQQIAYDNQAQYPEAAKAIMQNFYVDDFMACATNVHAAETLKNDLTTVLSQAGFNLRKWSSNSRQFLESIDMQDREVSTDTIIDITQTVKTLGLLWDTSSDSFKYSVALSEITEQITKRSVLSDIAKIFDPVGWISPIVVAMKIFMRKLWLRDISWDEELPHDLYNEWVEYHQRFTTIKELRIPRWLNYANEKDLEFHGFADSSELAYSAAIYLRVQSRTGEVYTNLIAAKTRVAPVKQVTLPRLELCAAHLMTKLMVKVQKSLNLPEVQSFGWSDSSIVLAWIGDHPRRWKSFIANRTAQIIGVIPPERWHHIPSQENPADLATRGLRPEDLVNNQLWWHGPTVLKQVPIIHHQSPPTADNIDLEERKEVSSHITTKSDVDIIERFSDYTRLLRVTARLLRFVHNCKSRKANLKMTPGYLTTTELQRAHAILLKKAQSTSYAAEIRSLAMGKQLSSTNKLAPLAPFIDNLGLMRVGGRIVNANVNYDQKHPVIINKDHHLTVIIIREYHRRYLHAGKRQLHYLLGLRYWIPGAMHVIKQCIFKCTTCMKIRSIPYQQQMGNIPPHRLNPGAAFINTGVDFAGPIQVRSWKGRGSKLYKCWIALFVCLVTKAIHVELVTELSTAAFIACLRRFVARRGKPMHIYSDNGTNFVGANQHLRELFQLLNTTSTQEGITKELADQQIQWHFSPPSGPHFGGIWEAGVKSLKYHLKRTLADASATYEELHTILCQIECCLNSRPICTKFEGDVDPLTPAHFLILRSATTIPDENLLNIKENALNRWRYLQRLVQQFWKKWSTEYLTQLQQRPKWTQKLKNLQIDDVVIIKDNNLPPSQWSIGRISELHPGSDGLVRVVTVRTTKGTFKRPIVKLCPLFLDV